MNKDNSINRENNKLIEYYFNKYSESNTPIPINFRTLFPYMNKSDRYTHLIHSYPAKLIPHIPYFFINNTYFTQEGDTILDPFCGTGTVLLEAKLAGRNSLGADANPLARKIAIVKTKKLDDIKANYFLNDIIIKAKGYIDYDIPSLINIDFWFSKEIQIQLAKINRAILEIINDDYKQFFELCFSNCIKKVSFADPRISVPVKLNPGRFKKNSDQYNNIVKRLFDLSKMDVFEKFKSICIENILRIKTLSSISDDYFSNIVSENAQRITKSLKDSTLIENNSIDLILTSPPYAGAQKYIRSSSLSLGWLGLTKEENLRSLDKKNIGRENYSITEIKEIKTGIISADNLLSTIFIKNKQRAYIVSNYLQEMKVALDECVRVLKNNRYLIIIIGNNKVCNYEFNTQEYLTEYLQSKGLILQFKLIDDIKSYGLMTKRNKTADIISREWIIVDQIEKLWS